MQSVVWKVEWSLSALSGGRVLGASLCRRLAARIASAALNIAAVIDDEFEGGTTLVYASSPEDIFRRSSNSK